MPQRDVEPLPQLGHRPHPTVTVVRGTLSIPESSSEWRPDTPLDDLNGALESLHEARQAWIATPLDGRIDLVRRVRARTEEVAEEWVTVACHAKGIARGHRAEGEEWQAGPWLLLRNLRLLQRSLEDLRGGKPPRLPGKVKKRGADQAKVPAFPTDVWDRIFFTGFTGEIWVDDEPDQVPAHQAAGHRPGTTVTPTLCVVLGAGNVSSIAPTDALYKLFVELDTVMLKVNPVNEYIGPILERAFSPLIDAGILRLAYGGVDVGEFLTTHPLVDAVHMTGSDKTHDAIVFGSGQAGKDRKAAGKTLSTKEITSELGSVTPVIVVPGPWTERDFEYQAESLAAMLTNNAGFNCVATRVIVQQSSWEHRQHVLDELARVLDSVPTRQAYYPGAEDRFETFLAMHPQAEQVGLRSDDRLPWTTIRDVDSTHPNEICFDSEAFASIQSEVGLDIDDPAAFVAAAVEFCNERLWGTLGATLLVHPRTPRKTKRAVRKALEDLRYGTVAVNQWSAIGFALMSTPWGAYPGATPADIQSGVGFVHNTYMLDRVHKSVVRGPWRVRPKPPWMSSHRRPVETLRALTRFEARPGLRRLIPVLYHSLRG